jgi:hypothetical protein
MIICTKAQILPLNSNKAPTAAEIGNEATVVAGAAESGKSAFDRALDNALSMEGARFNFVFDYPKDDHARALFSGCTLNRGNWLLLPARTIPESDG